MTFIDTNVLIDIFGVDQEWEHWSSRRLEEQTAERDGTINQMVVAELSGGFSRLADLLGRLEAASVRIASLNEDAAFLAGTAFARYRRERPRPTAGRVLSDFVIGAHASLLRLPLLTRDPTLYRRYFPDLTLITPETDNG